MTKRLENKKAVITGGTTGLGFAISERFLAEGAQVLLTGRSQDKVNEAVKKLGKGAFGLAGDASQLKDLQKLAAEAKRLFTTVDIVLANAGLGLFDPIDKVSEESFDQQFDINVKGVFFTVQQLLPLLKKGSSVILTSSGVNAKGLPNASLYAATKATVRSFARSFAAELGPQGIRVNALSPGLIPTQFFSNSNLGEQGYAQFEGDLQSEIPLGRAGKPSEIADAALFLASDDSSYMTAADLVIDGGWMNV